MRKNIINLMLWLLAVTLFSLSLFSSKVYAEDVKKYCNPRYGFCVSYLEEFGIEPASQNGDGRKFYTNDDFKMTIFGSNGVSGTAENIAKSYTEGITALTYKQSGKNWYALSGYKGDNVLYIKVYSGKGSFNCIIIEYPKGTKNENDQLVSHIVKSFKPGNTNIPH